MATFDSGSIKKYVPAAADTTTANTYAISDVTTAATLKLVGAGDTVYVNGLSSEYNVSATATKLTFKSATQTITVDLTKATGADNIVFIDGAYSAVKGAKSITLNDTVVSKSVALDTIDTKDSVAANKYFVTDPADKAAAAAAAAKAAADKAAADAAAAKAAADKAAADAKVIADAAALAKTFVLTSGADNLVGDSADNTLSGVLGSATASDNTLTTVDAVNGGNGNDTLNITVLGASGGNLGQLSSIETVNFRDVFGSGVNTYNALLATGIKNVNFTGTLAGQTSTISNLADLSTQVSLAGKGDLAVTYAPGTTAGSSDTSVTAINSVGSKDAAGTITRSTVNVSNTNTIEAVTLTATGTNYLTLAGGTALKTVTVKGDGDVNITGVALVGNATDGTLTYDASASTGKQTVTFGQGSITVKGGSGDDTVSFGATLGSTDSVDGGAGNDTVNFTIGTAVQLNPALTSVETINATFNAAGTINASKATGLTTVNFINAGGIDDTVSNLGSTATTLNFTKLDGLNHGAVSVSYATGANAAAVVNLGEQDTTTATGVAKTLGGLTLANAASLTVNSVRDSDNTALVTNNTGALDAGTATSLTLNTADQAALVVGGITASSATSLNFNTTNAFLNVGAITAANATTETVTANKGGFTQAAFVGAALTDLKLTSTNSAALVTGAVGTVGAATTASKLVNYAVTTGDSTSVNLGAIDAANLSTGTVDAVSALKTVAYDLGSKATVVAIGAINAIDETGAGANANHGVAQLDSVSFKLGADAVTNGIAVGAISARSVTAANFTVADQSVAHTSSATLIIDQTLTNATVAAGKNETFTLTINGIDDANAADLYNLAAGTITGSGAGNVVVNGFTTGVKSIADINLSAVTGTSEVAASTVSGTAGLNIEIGSGGTTATGVSGSNKADIITGGAKADTILGGAGADQITGGNGADVITGGTGADTIDLTETTSSVDTIKYAEGGALNADSVTGFKAGTDLVAFSATDADFGAIQLVKTNTADVAAGAALVANVTGSANLSAVANSVLFIAGTTGTSFASAIGATDVTTNAQLANTGIEAVYYDANNGQAVFGYVLGVNADTHITNADNFVEVTRVGVVAADYTYANISASVGAFF